jgi:hypothetical protein
MEIRIGTFWN